MRLLELPSTLTNPHSAELSQFGFGSLHPAGDKFQSPTQNLRGQIGIVPKSSREVRPIQTQCDRPFPGGRL